MKIQTSPAMANLFLRSRRHGVGAQRTALAGERLDVADDDIGGSSVGDRDSRSRPVRSGL